MDDKNKLSCSKTKKESLSNSEKLVFDENMRNDKIKTEDDINSESFCCHNSIMLEKS
jgi:hypothetical protein